MFTVTIETNNAAFDVPEGANTEISRILSDLAKHIDSTLFLEPRGGDNRGGMLFDRNGNRVGVWEFQSAEESI